MDLSDLNSVKAKTTEILQIYGYVDVLINNAGMTYRGNILDTAIEVDQRLMAVNYFGPLMLTKGMTFYITRYDFFEIDGCDSIFHNFALLRSCTFNGGTPKWAGGVREQCSGENCDPI